MSTNTALHALASGWLPVDGDDHGHELLEGPEFLEPGTDWGVKLLATADGICFGLSSDTDVHVLTRAESMGLRSSIENALIAERHLD